MKLIQKLKTLQIMYVYMFYFFVWLLYVLTLFSSLKSTNQKVSKPNPIIRQNFNFHHHHHQPICLKHKNDMIWIYVSQSRFEFAARQVTIVGN